MLNKKMGLVVSLAVALVLAVSGTAAFAATGEVQIALSDSGVTVDGLAASKDSSAAVYVGADLVYYHAGQGASYGEGTSADEHSAAEAAQQTVVTITEPGTYRVSGTLTAGQLAVDLGSEAASDPQAKVTLILDNANITCTVAPAVIFYNVWESSSTTTAGAQVVLADGSVNQISGSHVARVYKPGTTSKLYKYDGAFYSVMSMSVSGETLGTGALNIVADNEGLDSELHLTINSGQISIQSQDDGINTNEDGVSVTTINGGSLFINAGLGSEGDGVDSNGNLIINGGTLISLANGRSGDGGIDADGAIKINGGTVIALGSRNDAVSTDSKQPYLELSYATTQAANTLIHLEDSQGTNLLTFSPAKLYQSFTYSSPQLALDTPYALYSGGAYSGTLVGHGLYAVGGTYSGGTQQQYSGNGQGGMMGGGFAPNNADGTPPAIPDSSDRPALPDGVQPGGDQSDRPALPEGVQGTDGNPPTPPEQQVAVGDSAASTEFTLTAAIHSFSNVTAATADSGKTAVVFSVNANNTIADVAAGTPLALTYQGVTAKDGSAVTVPESDIQFTIMDVPSENYAATCLLSEGAAALQKILPTEEGTYRLTIAVVGSNAAYTGSSSYQFTIHEAGYVASSAADQSGFTDVPNGAWYAAAVADVTAQGLMKGTSDTAFSPTATVSRAMFATVLGRIAGATVDQQTQSAFTDVVKDGWSAGYIAWAAANQMMSGHSASEFGQYDAVTREQLCAIICNYAKYKKLTLPQSTAAVTFADADQISAWAAAAVRSCQQAGLVVGADGKFDPQGTVSRAEAAAIISRLMQVDTK